MNISTTSRTLQLLSRIFDTENPTEPFLPPSGEKRSIPLRPPRQPFDRATPESEGISSDHIRRFLEELGRGGDLFMQDVLVLRHGKILCSAAYGAQTLDAAKYTFSACKSITSLAIGLLLDDGLLNLDDEVADLFVDLIPPAAQRRLKKLCIEDLLTMRSGIQFSEIQSATETDWLHSILSAPLGFEPGTQFQYNSLNTYLLSAIILRKSGMSLTDLLQKRLFQPMGITDILWERCPCGIEKGGWGLYIRPEDLAKLGQLVLDGGVWNGTQLISRAYLAVATSASVSPTDEGITYDYGYQIWVGRKENSFLFNGMLGQNVLGFRDSGILIVTNAGADTDYQESRYFEIVSRYFGGNFPDSLPENKDAEKRLHALVQKLSFYHRTNETPNQYAAPFLDRSFTVTKPTPSVGLLPVVLQVFHNNYTRGITSLAITAKNDLPELIYRERDATYRLPVGLGVPQITELDFHGDRFRIAAHGRFTHDEEDRPVFYIRLDFLETPCVRILKLIHTDSGLVLRQSETPGVPYLCEKLSAAAQQPLSRPFLLMALGGSDEEYLRYKCLRLLSPEIPMLPDGD